MTASRLNRVSRKASALRPGLAFLAVSAIALALTGCKHTDDPTRVEGWTLVDASERHPILVSQQPTTHIVKVPPGANGLSGGQRAQLLDFADHYRATDNGASRLVIQAPSGGANEVSSMYAVSQIRALLTDQGFAENMISVEAYDANGTREPPIRVSYLRFVAEPPPCGNWSTNLADEPMNLPHPDLGCANQHNLAAMVANPADLLGPRSETARDSMRRDQVFTKYINGQPTGARKSADERVNKDTSN
ncbi:MAG: CpaD family pilus assembly protein [Hyphomicrobium sp.]